MKISNFRLKQPFNAAVTGARYSRRLPGLLGREDTAGNYTVTVPGGAGYKFVMILAGGHVSSLSIAIDRGAVGTTGGTPIWLDYENDGRLIIIGLRYEGS